MTIYSQHPHRGKVQVLATYRGSVGVVSTTVTSVDTAALASPIVDALNRISACATVPVSVHDMRGGRFRYYPAEHLGALTDRNARSGLLVGAHSLWYEYVKALLHDGLIRLDRAMESVPAPVRKAIEAELSVEERELRVALAGYDGDAKGGGGDCREWRFESPFVSFGDIAELTDEGRADLDRVERGVTHERVGDGVVDLRLLLEACRHSANPGAKLDAGYFAITDDPGGATPDGFYLSVEAPMPNGDFDRNCWRVEVCRWVPDEPDDEEGGATGESVLQCALFARPTVAEVVELLNASAHSADRLAVWAKTPVGESLGDTVFVVTARYED